MSRVTGDNSVTMLSLLCICGHLVAEATLINGRYVHFGYL